MGPEHNTDLKFFLMTPDGPLEISPATVDLSCCSNGPAYISPDPPEIGHLSFQVELRMLLRCKNRKRFVRLLKSFGVERNAANQLASIVRRKNQRLRAGTKPDWSFDSYQGLFLTVCLMDWMGEKV